MQEASPEGDPLVTQTRFVIVCQPRTGSNWLCTLLQSHPSILCHHEVFHPEDIYYAVGHRDGQLEHLGTREERDRDPLGFLERLWEADFGRPIVGLKLHEGHAPAVQARVLADKSVRKVLLRRRSRLRACISLLRARQTGRWARTPYDGVSVVLDPGEVFDFARRYDAFYAGLRAATRTQPALEVVYEDLQRDPRVLARLLEFLGADAGAAELSARTVRQSRDSLREALSNYEELACGLRGSALESELEEAPLTRNSSQGAA